MNPPCVLYCTSQLRSQPESVSRLQISVFGRAEHIQPTSSWVGINPLTFKSQAYSLNPELLPRLFSKTVCVMFGPNKVSESPTTRKTQVKANHCQRPAEDTDAVCVFSGRHCKASRGGDCVTQHKQKHSDTVNMTNGSRMFHKNIHQLGGGVCNGC